MLSKGIAFTYRLDLLCGPLVLPNIHHRSGDVAKTFLVDSFTESRSYPSVEGKSLKWTICIVCRTEDSVGRDDVRD